jgi:fatty acid desaturase
MSPQAARESVDDCAREVVRDLHQPNPRVFWTDLVVTAIVGWSSFWGALVLHSYAAFGALVVASLAIYRGLCFIHELTHIRAKALPGFETVWNLLFGAPLLLPSFVYVGVHQDHHKLSTYGTTQDPEYMPFAKSNLMVIFFVAHSVLIPAFLLLRFVVIAPLALLVPALHRWLAVHASALSMNLAYERDINHGTIRSMKIWESLILVLWGCFFAAMISGVVSWRVLWSWYLVTAAVSVINTLRTLGAHDYESEGSPMDRTNQLLDSIDTPGAPWTELWAPVGLRYHALHHYFPGIPYHNLPEAHRRLIATLPHDAPYRQTISSGLLESLRKLYTRGRSARLSHLRRAPKNLSHG